MLASKVAAVAGFSNVGKGYVESLHAHGACVLITEINPINTLQKQTSLLGFCTNMKTAITLPATQGNRPVTWPAKSHKGEVAKETTATSANHPFQLQMRTLVHQSNSILHNQ